MAKTAAQWQSEILRKVGGDAVPVNAIFRLALPLAVSAGTWTVNVNGSVTGVLAYNVSVANFLAALEALDTVGVGGVLVDGSRKRWYQMEMVGDNGGASFDTPAANGSGLTPAAAIAVEIIAKGRPSRLSASCAAYWNDRGNEAEAGFIADEKLRSLYVRCELLKEELARYRELTDSRTVGGAQSEDRQRFLNLQALLSDCHNEILAAENADLAATDALNRRGMAIRDMKRVTPNGKSYGTFATAQNGRRY